MFDGSVLKRTGQWWKAVLSSMSILLGGLTMFAGLLMMSGGQATIALGLVFGGMLMAVLGFSLACITIRCPACGARWVWLATREQKLDPWLRWLVSQTQCPTCERT